APGLDVGPVLGEHRPQHALAVLEVVLDRGRALGPGRPVDHAEAHRGDAVAGEELFGRRDDPLAHPPIMPRHPLHRALAFTYGALVRIARGERNGTSTGGRGTARRGATTRGMGLLHRSGVPGEARLGVRLLQDRDRAARPRLPWRRPV